AAKKAGKIRYIGFTGHKDPVVHLRMLEIARANRFHFDACQLPLNVMDAHFRSFAQRVVPKIVEQGIAVLGMKPLGEGNVMKCATELAKNCLHYALSPQTSVVITGCESMHRLYHAIEALDVFRPLTSTQIATLLDKTKEFAMAGKFEPFKTTAMFDGTAQ